MAGNVSILNYGQKYIHIKPWQEIYPYQAMDRNVSISRYGKKFIHTKPWAEIYLYQALEPMDRNVSILCNG